MWVFSAKYSCTAVQLNSRMSNLQPWYHRISHAMAMYSCQLYVYRIPSGRQRSQRVCISCLSSRVWSRVWSRVSSRASSRVVSRVSSRLSLSYLSHSHIPQQLLPSLSLTFSHTLSHDTRTRHTNIHTVPLPLPGPAPIHRLPPHHAHTAGDITVPTSVYSPIHILHHNV